MAPYRWRREEKPGGGGITAAGVVGKTATANTPTETGRNSHRLQPAGSKETLLLLAAVRISRRRRRRLPQPQQAE